MKFKKQLITTIHKTDDGYEVSKARFVGLNLEKPFATFDFSTNTAHLYGKKIKTKDIEMYYRDVKAHYKKNLRIK